MDGEELYTMFLTEFEAVPHVDIIAWTSLTPEEREAWDRLAYNVTIDLI